MSPEKGSEKLETKGREITRRALLIGAAGMASGAAALSVFGKPVNDGGGDLAERRRAAKELRIRLAQDHAARPLRHHPGNGDEESYPGANGLPRYLGNYSKGLKHDGNGEVDYAAYQVLLKALRSGDPDLFDLVQLGGETPVQYAARLRNLIPQPERGARFYRIHSERELTYSGSKQLRLTDPQAGLAFDLEGADGHAFVMRPPPRFDGKEVIAEIAESYWMALARDVPFLDYSNDQTVKMAYEDLNRYAEFRGPKDNGKVTVDTIFRGATAGDLLGPYVSQFLVRDIPFGAYQVSQQVVYAFQLDAMNREQVFLIRESDYLNAQNGTVSDTVPALVQAKRYISRGRDLANFVHIDELFQAYLNAALILGSEQANPKTGGRDGLGAPHDEGNPYDGYVGLDANGVPQGRSGNQAGFGTLGEPNIASLVAEVASRALKAVWYQKWFVHRRLRPEAYAGRIYFNEIKKLNYPFDATEYSILKRAKGVLEAVAGYNKDRNGDPYFLPMAFPEGCPTHPAYGAGHATVAGACVTVLKAFYREETTFAELGASIFIPTGDGKALQELKKGGQPVGPYKYEDLAPKMTIGGELNKLASNISLGRDFAGVHWRSDHAESLKLGEQVALQLLRDVVQTYNEHVAFNVTLFDGTKVQINNI
jgi:hypothetical protein